MSRLPSDLRTFARTSLRGLRANPVTTGVAIATIGITLVLVGAFALLVTNMEGLLDRVGDDLRVTAYLADGLSEADRQELVRVVGTVEGVRAVEYVSKDEALARFRERVGGQSGLLDALDENPLPSSLEITLAPSRRSPEGLRTVVEALDGLPGIADLAYGQEWVEGYARVIGLVRGLGAGVGLVLGLAALGIVGNTIRLAVYARRDEIDILALVGASRPFIATPFLVEGLLQGAAGGVLALGLLYVLFRGVLPGLEAGLELLLGYAEPSFFSGAGMLQLVAAGAGLGFVGSAAALVRGWQA